MFGFCGVVLDKDGTLTEPYASKIASKELMVRALIVLFCLFINN
jgi:hypothetical protein